MNIFYTSISPELSASYLDNKRVVKMCLESAQVLSTVLRLYGVEDDILYKSTHKGHPCTKWVMKSRQHYKWLLAHFKALNEEYKLRYNNGDHLSYTKLYNILKRNSYILPLNGFIDPPSVTGDLSGTLGNVCQEYKQYLNNKWEKERN